LPDGFAFSFRAALAAAAFVAASSATKAEDFAALAPGGAGVERFAPASQAWTAVIMREPAIAAPVAASDPGWTTVVATSTKPAPTPSLARRQPTEPPLAGPRLTGTTHALNGLASYYWQEQITATGERFDKAAMTAAHKTLPLGTRVRVIRVDNGSSVIVRINDRGPFKPGRIIDLSQGAAERLGMMSAGLASVKLEVLGK
jgi:rare lipoprotein A